MTKPELILLTNEELQVELKKRKTTYTIGAFIVGMMIGCAVWSAVKNGFSLFLFVPLIFAYWFRNAKTDYDLIKKEIETRL